MPASVALAGILLTLVVVMALVIWSIRLEAGQRRGVWHKAKDHTAYLINELL